MTLRTVPPRLLAILAALTDEPEPWWQEQVRSGWLTYEGIYSWVSAFPWQGVAGWRTTEAAEAFELLVTAGLLPDTWVGDPTRAWCCARCDGKAEITNLAAAPEPCRVCENGALPLGSPLSIPALIGWVLPDSSVRLQQEELARAALPFLQSKGLPSGPVRILWRSFRREVYGKTIPVAWVAPGGHLVTLYDCLDVRGRWWSRDDSDPPRCPSLQALWEQDASLDGVLLRADLAAACRVDLRLAYAEPALPPPRLLKATDE